MPSPGRSPAPIRCEIDRINIHQASLRAMQRAVLALAPLPDIVLVDAFRVPDLPMAQRGVPHGDRRCSAIAAASIVAKVTRDRQMLELHAPRSALRVRPPQRIRDGRSPRRRCAVSATRMCTGDRSGRRPCLIRWTESLNPCRLIVSPHSETPRSCSGRASSNLPSRNTCASSTISRATGTSTQHARRSLRARRPDRQGGRAVRSASPTALHDEGSCRRPARSTRRSSSSSRTTSRRWCRLRKLPRSQGLLADARVYFKTVADRRRARGDARGARK